MMAFPYQEEDYYFYYSKPPCLLDLDSDGLGGPESGGEVQFLSEQMSLVMQSPVSSDRSTGYLQDAVAQWGDRCKKRRRMLLFSDHDQPTTAENVEDIFQEFWNWNCHEDPFADLNCLSNEDINIPGDPFDCSIYFKETTTTLQKDYSYPTAAEAATADFLLLQKDTPLQEPISSPSSSHKNSTTTDQDGKCTSASKDTQSSGHCSTLTTFHGDRNFPDLEGSRKKKMAMGVVYPFAVVKPGGVEGDVTLDDINERILRRPTRPVRHPVGEFACLPCVSSAAGPGLSGKAVMGLTRIHTQGRGTITIIRTRG